MAAWTTEQRNEARHIAELAVMLAAANGTGWRVELRMMAARSGEPGDQRWERASAICYRAEHAARFGDEHGQGGAW